MTRISKAFLFTFLCGATLAACGGDDDDTTADARPDSGGGGPDAAPDSGGGGGACSEFGSPATTLSTYPASFDGDLAGAGFDLTVGSGICTDERGYYPPLGEDQVVRLTGLTEGGFYQVAVTSAADTSFYVATGCTPTGDTGGPGAGMCLFFNDSTGVGETGAFVGPAGGEAFVVVDNFNDQTTPADATYTLNVTQVECIDSFDCSGDTPVCDSTGTCVAGPTECVGDDGAEPDDGPTQARALTLVATPTSLDGSICNVPDFERDWYSFTSGAGGVGLELAWATTEDLDMELYDATGALVTTAATLANPESIVNADLPAGDYFVSVLRYIGISTPDPAAIAYTLTAYVPECSDFFDCTADEPICTAAGLCSVGFSACTGDDPADSGGSDDGPLGATDVTPAVGATITTTAAVCSDPAAEVDFYSVTVAAGEGIDATLTFAGPADLDLYITDSVGTFTGQSFWLIPERVTVTYLPAGTYYVLVRQFSDTPVTAATAYTLAVTRTAAETCTTAAECAEDYSTQFFRGSCTGGVCQSIVGNGAVADGQPCDSSDDCVNGFCGYIAFEADADKAVCSLACNTDSDCANLGAGFACTVGIDTIFGANVCLPLCTSNLECGVFSTGSSTLDTDQPWDYGTCNVTSGACGP